MKLHLAYENELDLPNLPTFKGRVGYVNKHIFENKNYIVNEPNNKMTFEEYYNICSPVYRNEEEEKQMKDRWLGVKRVGSPHKDETLKITIDFITGYLLGSKNHSVKHEIHMFKLLKKKELRGEELTEEELNELRSLESDVISYRFSEEDVVFFFNHAYENQIKKLLRETEDNEVKESLKNKIKSCKSLRSRARVVNNNLKSLDKQLEQLMAEAKELYSELKKDRNNEELFTEVADKIKKSRKIRYKISDLETELSILTDDYQIITELQVNYQ